MKNKHDDYEGFVEKFKPKKTTDDCYTPPAVYEAVRDWVCRNLLPPGDWHIVRPFYPGGDYQRDAENYDERTVVIDNPPFSISSQIYNFYLDRGIRFFLFAPHLTSAFCKAVFRDGCASVITASNMVYENGAIVPTSFVTSLLPPDVLIRTEPALAAAIEDARKRSKVSKARPKHKYPVEVLTARRMEQLLSLGRPFSIPRRKAVRVSRLDDGYALFGGGIFVSRDIALQAEQARKEDEQPQRIPHELSDRERALIDGLSR